MEYWSKSEERHTREILRHLDNFQAQLHGKP